MGNVYIPSYKQVVSIVIFIDELQLLLIDVQLQDTHVLNNILSSHVRFSSENLWLLYPLDSRNSLIENISSNNHRNKRISGLFSTVILYRQMYFTYILSKYTQFKRHSKFITKQKAQTWIPSLNILKTV